jgi:hypothetical protein
MITMRRLAILSSLVAAAVAVSAQPAVRRVTNIGALIAFPGFYHLRPIVIGGELERQDDGQLRMSSEDGSVKVVFKGVAEGLSEVRGEYWDLGRMNADDPRLATMDLQATFQFNPEGPWPRPGQVTAIVASAIASTTAPVIPSIRAMVLHPARYLDQTVTVTGQFTGRNLLGDLPDSPANSPYDFVLRSADAAIWVSHIRPRGKDFDLALDARIDTGRWLQVTGVLQRGRGLQWINARTGSVALVKAPVETTSDEPIRVPAGAPPEVVFSAPTQDEIEVDVSTNVRIQFSRDIDAASFKGRVRVTYRSQAETGAAAVESTAEEAPFTTQYQAGNRMLEIRLTRPLERFRTVQVELLEGIQGTDEQALPPWTLTFETGG